ncbi:epoxide hydrolase family protein [Chondrinema litorale]|uniref:epoxide hydrolase family protein n=1 Tax=Chondrinema litorale TaxID=2994555 RepID=UPI0025429116|nr:epoxide hydrolase family protein [Chondrinema litorale]UZR96524.1 epoxide hydrolase [Chondrinema litorale]
MMIDDFKVNIAETEIADLKECIKKTRWPDELKNSQWTYGTNLSYLKELAEYWQSEFDWRKTEEKINAYPNFIAEIDGCKIHFIHVKSERENAIPILITHGWPGSFLEMFKVIDCLKNSEELAFDIIVPSIIGFGFSEKITTHGVDYGFVADLWHKLILQLGYKNYSIQGGDIGAGISIRLAQQHPESIIALHLNYISDSYQPYLVEGEKLSDEELAYKSFAEKWNATEGAYGMIQSTKPLSLAYGLNDSPIGLCAWIIEKFNSWSDNDGYIENCFTKDELLSNVSLYWFTQTIHSSMRMYHAISQNPMVFGPHDFVKSSVGFANFPKEIPTPPRSYIEKGLNLIQWTNMPKGGHFAALEQPELLATDIISLLEKVI